MLIHFWLLFVPTNHIKRLCVASRVALRWIYSSWHRLWHSHAHSTYTIISTLVSISRLLWSDTAKQAAELLMCIVWVCKATEGKKLTGHWFTSCTLTVLEEKLKKTNNFFLRNKPFIHHSISAASKLRGWQCGSSNMVHWRSALNYSQGEFQVCKLFWILPEIHKDQKMRRRCSSPQERFYTFTNTSICLWNLGVGTVWIMFYVCPIPDLIRFQEKLQAAICIQLETLFVNIIQGSPFSNSFSSLFSVSLTIAPCNYSSISCLVCISYATCHFNVTVFVVAYSGDHVSGRWWNTVLC